MSRVYGEPVEVQTREDGRPVSFAWRGRRYAVIAVQEHWMVNRDWWREPAPVPAQPELQFWRVEASPGPRQMRQAQMRQAQTRQAQPAGTYELRRDTAVGTWTLRRIAD
jgi:hypothetical protein